MLVGYQLRPYVVPKLGRHSIDQFPSLLSQCEVGLWLRPKDHFQCLLLGSVEGESAGAYCANGAVILLLLCLHNK
jgi:hypothetical protein